jgi:hypothetical protein
MTLEASLIIPMVICVIVMLIWGSYYMYNRAILSQDCYVLAFRASVRADAKKKMAPSEYVSKSSAEQAGAKYFGATKPTFSADQSGKEVKVTGETGIRTNAMGKYFLKIGTGWELKATLKAKIRNDPKHVRRVKRLMDIGGKLP